MSAEPLTTSNTPADAAASTETGLLIVVLLMVLSGVTAMLLMA
jgi:hypothetical protein